MSKDIEALAEEIERLAKQYVSYELKTARELYEQGEYEISDSWRDRANKTKKDFIEGYKACLAAQSQSVEGIKTLNQLLEQKEIERKEWADMCIKKQARIEELESKIRV